MMSVLIAESKLAARNKNVGVTEAFLHSCPNCKTDYISLPEKVIFYDKNQGVKHIHESNLHASHNHEASVHYKH
jgi:hypothetical protein